MKRTSKKRLTLARETVKALVMELSRDQLGRVGGGMTSGNVSIVTTGPSYSCPNQDSYYCV